MTQTVGLDQSCPWSPGLYSVTVAETLQTIDAELKKENPHAFACAFYDDAYLVGMPKAVAGGLERLRQVLAEVGLELNVAKTQVWSPDPELALPRSLSHYRAEQLKCVGAAVPLRQGRQRGPGARRLEGRPHRARLCVSGLGGIQNQEKSISRLSASSTGRACRLLTSWSWPGPGPRAPTSTWYAP